ncbi:MAG TPA: carbohydrate porin [Kofleriaceae bacterium]|jgi:porin|nr:carbohydrate porin [Kofleriaceae bacterium]
MRLGEALAALVVLAAGSQAHAEPDVDRGWLGGEHLTGEWAGSRDALASRGVLVDAVYASDAFTARGKTSIIGHLDAALTLDSHGLGLWDGGMLHVLVQNSVGRGINDVWSAQPVTNLQAAHYTELAELFLEQAALDDRLRVRIGKQDANRDFGTPRFDGDFLNNSFGMYPTAPLPSYPTTGLGAIVIAKPVAWLTGKLAIYEGSPLAGGLGLTNAFEPGGGYTLVGGAAATHELGSGRDGGTTSGGVWRQSGEFTDLMAPGAAPRTFDHDLGWFVQHDERIYLHPDDPADPRGLTVIVRASWAEPDRSAITRYAGGSAAWRGIGPRRHDTVGVGGGYFRVTQPLRGSPGPMDESFVEAFYLLRLTSFVTLQPDVQAFRHPGGDSPNAVVAGIRVKLRL